MFLGRLLGEDLGHCGPTRPVGIEHLHKESPKRTHGCPDTITPVVILCRGISKDVLSRKKRP